MKKQSLYLSFLLFFIVGGLPSVLAQENKYEDIIKVEGLKNKKYLATVSGIADIEFFKPVEISYGMSFSGSIRLLYKPKLNKGKSVYTPLIIEREIFIKPTFGYIYRKRFNTAFLFIPELAYRHTFYKGMFVELDLCAGYMYTKLNAPVYERQNDGTFKEVSFGFHNLILGGKVLTGYDFSKKLKTPLAINFGAGLYYRYPGNQDWIRRITIELGVSYVFRKVKE